MLETFIRIRRSRWHVIWPIRKISRYRQQWGKETAEDDKSLNRNVHLEENRILRTQRDVWHILKEQVTKKRKASGILHYKPKKMQKA